MSDSCKDYAAIIENTSVKLAVDLGGFKMANPVTVGSGTFASGREYSDFVDLRHLGAITTKGVSAVPWEGNPGVRLAETASGMLNSIGLQNPGVETFIKKDLTWLREQGLPVIVNIAGHSINDYIAVIEALEEQDGIGAFEVNISCPNVDAGGMTFGCHPEAAAAVVRECRARTKRPLIIKLTPNVTDVTVIAQAAEAEGADAISLINSILGMAIDAKTRKPVLHRVVGGLSGPAVKPVALRMVWQCAQAVSVPLLGMGGIRTGEDAVEFMLAGATAVAVGMANFNDPRATEKVLAGIISYCEEEGVDDVRELIGGLQC